MTKEKQQELLHLMDRYVGEPISFSQNLKKLGEETFEFVEEAVLFKGKLSNINKVVDEAGDMLAVFVKIISQVDPEITLEQLLDHTICKLKERIEHRDRVFKHLTGKKHE